MKRFILAAAAALLTGGAAAQTSVPSACPCAPFEDSASYYALVLSHNFIGGPGPWLAWSCYSQAPFQNLVTPPPPQRCLLAARWQDITLAKLGDRAETVRRASDPIAAFKASWRRHVDRSMSDPSLAEVRAAIIADLRSGGR